MTALEIGEAELRGELTRAEADEERKRRRRSRREAMGALLVVLIALAEAVLCLWPLLEG
jgi:ferric-dicitrate binding protein FerR (iron transport regulator)